MSSMCCRNCVKFSAHAGVEGGDTQLSHDMCERTPSGTKWDLWGLQLQHGHNAAGLCRKPPHQVRDHGYVSYGSSIGPTVQTGLVWWKWTDCCHWPGDGVISPDTCCNCCFTHCLLRNVNRLMGFMAKTRPSSTPYSSPDERMYFKEDMLSEQDHPLQ